MFSQSAIALTNRPIGNVGAGALASAYALQDEFHLNSRMHLGILIGDAIINYLEYNLEKVDGLSSKHPISLDIFPFIYLNICLLLITAYEKPYKYKV